MRKHDCIIHKFELVLSHRQIMAQGILDWLEEQNLDTDDLKNIAKNDSMVTVMIEYVIDYCKRLEWFNDLDYNVWKSLIEDTLATLTV